VAELVLAKTYPSGDGQKYALFNKDTWREVISKAWCKELVKYDTNNKRTDNNGERDFPPICFQVALWFVRLDVFMPPNASLRGVGEAPA